MSDLNKVARSSIRGSYFLFLGMTSSTIIMALTSVLFARLLGPQDYGLYSVILTVPIFLITLCDVGISPSLTRFSAHLSTEGRKIKVASLIKVGILLKITLSLIISTFLIIFSEVIAKHVLNRPGIGPLIRIASIYIIGHSVLNSVISTFIGLDEAGKSSLLMNIQAVIKAVASPLLIILGLGVSGALIGTGIGFGIAAVSGTAMLLLFTYPRLKSSNEPSEKIIPLQDIKMMISYGAPLYISALIGGFHLQVQSILLALFTSNINIGNYETAMNFTMLIHMLASPISTSLFPAFSKLNMEKDRNSIGKMFKLSVKYTSLIIIPASTAVALLSKNIVHTIYGSQYQTAPSYLALYIFSFFLTGIGMYVIRALFNSQGGTRTTFQINIIDFAISIPIALKLLPTLGVPGLIISIFISKLVSIIYGLIQVRRIYRLNVDWSSTLRIISASLSSTLPIILVFKILPTANPIYGLAFGGILYMFLFLILAPIFGAVNREDIENLKDLINELPLIYPIAEIILRFENKILELNIIPRDM